MNYSGWELKFFDASKNFRNYQYNLIKKYIGNKVLEVGPGSGNFAKKFLVNKVNSVSLSEINTDLKLRLDKKFEENKNVKIISKEISKIDDTFDTICYFDVIEHIEFHEEEIFNALKKLKKNGHLIIIVPAFNYLFSNYDKSVGHYRRYEKKFFVNFFKKNDYLINKKLIYFDSVGFFFLLLNKIINSEKKTIGLATFIWNLLIPISKLLDLITFNSFGKSLLCVIKK